MSRRINWRLGLILLLGAFFMRNFVVVIALAAVTACGPANAPPEGVQASAESVQPHALEIPAPVPSGEDLLAGLARGGSATIKIDACPAEFDAKTRLGTIVCGQSYLVFYEANTKRWGAVGPDALKIEANAQETRTAAKNPGPEPMQRVVVLWGLSLAVDDKYGLALEDGTVVGHLLHTTG